MAACSVAAELSGGPGAALRVAEALLLFPLPAREGGSDIKALSTQTSKCGYETLVYYELTLIEC